MQWLGFLILFSIFEFSTATVDSKISVNEKGFFIDQWGRVRIFHGLNAVQKSHPYFPQKLLNESIVNLYKNWGFNVARLGVIWGVAHPHPDFVDRGYINKTMEIVENLENNGIYTLLDAHQDVMSSKYLSDGYDGFPLWLVDQLPSGWLPYPLPFSHEKIHHNWALAYLTFELGGKFQAFYENSTNSWGHFGNFWRTLASIFGQKQSILGYDLMNEPWAGDIWSSPLLLFPGNAGKYNLQPLYDQIACEIAIKDTKTILFYEPVTWGVFKSGSGKLSSGFEHVPGGEKFKNRTAFSFHYYCWPTEIDPTLNYTFPVRAFCHLYQQSRTFSVVAENKKNLGGGSMLTEFGKRSLEESEYAMRHADKYFESWTFWNGVRETTTNEKKLKTFIRAYPMAIAGEPKRIYFDPKTGKFNFRYAIDLKIEQPTEIFLPAAIHYKNGYRLTINPQMRYGIEGNVLLIKKPARKNLKNGAVIRVAIRAK